MLASLPLSAAWGQGLNPGPAPLPLTEELGVQAAIEKARQSKRLLFIFWCCDSPSNPNWTFRRAARSVSLRAYIKWHCVSIQAAELPPALLAKALRQHGHPGSVVVVRDGDVEKVIASKGPNPVAGPLEILYQADVTMDCIRARDPVWVELHDRANPAPPPPPEPEPMSNTKDDLAPIVWDPRPEEKIGVLDRLQQARELMKSGDLYQATGFYSWLWERGAAVDPSFRAAKLSALAQDIAALTAKRPASKERFEKIRAVRTERMPWAEFGQMHEWFVLNAATDDAFESLEYLDYFTNDLDESSSMPPADAMAYKLLTRREDFAKAWQLPPRETTAQARVASIVQRLNPRFPASTLPAAREEYRAFARQFLVDEGSRLYVALLVKGDDVGAQEIARQILAASNDGPTRVALVTTALAADPAQARPIHLTWLSEAEAAGVPARGDLRTRVMLGTNLAPRP